MKYRTIVADPPWSFGAADDQRQVGFPRTPSKWSRRVLKPMPFPTMGESELRALPIDELGQRDCNLFCWSTQRHLPLCLQLVREWGFGYRQTLVWQKTSALPVGGSVAPNDVEFLVVSSRGIAGWTGRLRSCVTVAPQQKKHSRKPDAFLDYVEQISPGPYLELFARRQRLGWDTWGNEALEHVGLTA